MNNQEINIVYYSGTGGTKRVAKCFETACQQVGYKTSIHRLFQNVAFLHTGKALLLLIYAVHAGNAPEPVYKWIDSLGDVSSVPAVVISVSGGGEVIFNTACRASVIKRLEKKGYQVCYERMLVMPSNWIVATKKPLAQMLLDVLPKKVMKIVDDMEKGTIRRTKPLLLDRLLSRMGELEKIGAKSFGKRIQVSKRCIGCGWCVTHCPAGNITLKSDKPEFGNECHLCLACIYGCPHNALSPGIGKFFVIYEGFDLRDYEGMRVLSDDVDIEMMARGYLWRGVRDYLLDRE